MNLIRGAVTGNYELLGDPARADCIIGHSFGSGVGPGTPNHFIALTVLGYAQQNETLPYIVDRTVQLALPEGARQPDLVVGGPISNYLGTRGGTFGVLARAREYMDEYGLNRPLTVAQAFHAGRVAAQSIKLGMEPILPPGLPRNFDKYSNQSQTRSQRQWAQRELAGIVGLRILRQI
jgi:hypothetical protein